MLLIKLPQEAVAFNGSDIGGSGGGCQGRVPPPPGKSVKWVELPSGCVVPGSWSGPLALKAKLICGGLLG